MLKIGEFSSLSQITIHMLRHYNDIGLLMPVYIDDFTGYRYYNENQIPIANKINSLKNMGLSLNSIKEIIHTFDDECNYEKYLKENAIKKKNEIEKMQKQLLLINNTIKTLNKKSNLPKINIVIKEIPKRIVVSYRDTISNYNQEGKLWSKLSEEVDDKNIQLASPHYDMAIFHDNEYRENGIDVEIQRSVVKIYDNTEKINFKIVNPIIAATLAFEGAYDYLSEANELLAEWLVSNEYTYHPPRFNIYHISPEKETTPDKMITEVCFPFVKK
jgi:DNA-binding transcriptional MerR regulator